MKVDIPDDILAYESNFFAGMSPRQTGLSLIGIALTSVSFFMYNSMQIGSNVIWSWVSMAGGIPFFLFAFYKWNGLPLEKFISIYLDFKLFSHQKRKWMAENDYYEYVFKQGDIYEEQDLKKKKAAMPKQKKSMVFLFKGGRK
jgi:hypothetical protein